MKPRKKFPLRSPFKIFYPLLLVLSFFILPCKLYADPDSLVLVRMTDGIDLTKLSELKKLKPATAVKINEKGDLVVSYLNYSISLAHDPFGDNQGTAFYATREPPAGTQK